MLSMAQLVLYVSSLYEKFICTVRDCTCGRRHSKNTATGNSSGGEFIVQIV